MQFGFIVFLAAFSGFYLGLAAFLIFRNLLGRTQERDAGVDDDLEDISISSVQHGEGNAHT